MKMIDKFPIPAAATVQAIRSNPRYAKHAIRYHDRLVQALANMLRSGNRDEAKRQARALLDDIGHKHD